MSKIIVPGWFLVFVLFLIIGNHSYYADDKDNKYDVSEIPEELLKDADAVVRNNSSFFKVKDEEDAELSCVYAVTILNKKGQHFGYWQNVYDKFTEIDDFEARLYNAAGEEIRKLDDDEVIDVAELPWAASLYSDDHIMIAELYNNEYPYTVEFKYKKKFDGYLGWPGWAPEEIDASVQYSSYEILLPEGYDLRSRSYNWNVEPRVMPRKNNFTSYLWDISNLPPFKLEPYGPSGSDQVKKVLVVPGHFKLDDYEGDMSTWEGFGQWTKTLWEGKQKLSVAAIDEAREQITDDMSTEEKVSALYKYMQSRTRYANLNAGIGGWQPVDAEKVHECGYGDCKALSNYMVALLDCADIKAYPVVIECGSNPDSLDMSLSCQQFNHVIVCVPGEKDTTWLECTDQTLPCGFLSDFTENRYGMLISDEGGTFVRTPASSSKMNKKVFNAVVDLEKGEADISINYSGNRALGCYMIKSTGSYDDWVKKKVAIPSSKILNDSLIVEDDSLVAGTLNAKVSLKNYASTMGSRIFFTPRMINSGISVPDEVESRKFSVVLDCPDCLIDTVKYILPANTVVEALPEDVEIETEYYKFVTHTEQVDSSQIMYIRYLEYKTYKMPPAMYEPFRNLLQTVVQTDSKKVVLKKE